MNLTVGLLTSNCEQFLPAQLDSLVAGLAGVADWRLVVADSGSTDGTLDLVAQLAPYATVVVLAGNPGFAAQSNAVAAAHPPADATLILSRTARLQPGCAAALLRVLEEDPLVGVAVPRLFTGDIYGGNPGLRASLRRRPTLLRAWGEALLGGRITRSVPWLTEVIAQPENYSSTTRFEWATGGVTMFSRACQHKLRGWDESFFLYSEETDYELRAADLGFKVRFVEDAQATHVGGESRVRPEFFAHTYANKVRLYGRRHGRLAANAFWAALIVNDMLRLRSDTVLRKAALRKLFRERAALVAGQPARRPPGY